jgi:DNA-binding NtrC family response regulator
MAEILVVDDEIGIRELLSEILGDEGHNVLVAESAQQARSVRDANPVDLVLLDIWMPDTDGVTLLKEWAANGKLSMPVIMMSGHATIDTAVEATRIGAMDFLEKPIALQKLLKAVENGLQRKRGVVAPPAPVRMAPAPMVNSTFRPVNPAALGLAGMPSAPAPASANEFFGGVPVGSGAIGAGRVLGQGPAVHTYQPSPAHNVTAFAPVGAPANSSTSITLRELPLDAPLREARDAFERAYFEHHLAREHGSMTRVAERTGLERTHLYRKLKQLGIDLSRGAYRKNQA